MANESIYTIVLASRAQKEITQSWAWYEDRQQGLGDRFLKIISRGIREKECNPMRSKAYFVFLRMPPR